MVFFYFLFCLQNSIHFYIFFTKGFESTFFVLWIWNWLFLVSSLSKQLSLYFTANSKWMHINYAQFSHREFYFNDFFQFTKFIAFDLWNSKFIENQLDSINGSDRMAWIMQQQHRIFVAHSRYERMLCGWGGARKILVHWLGRRKPLHLVYICTC